MRLAQAKECGLEFGEEGLWLSSLVRLVFVSCLKDSCTGVTLYCYLSRRRDNPFRGTFGRVNRVRLRPFVNTFQGKPL